MADDVLVEQLMALQLVAKEEGLELAFSWLGKAVAKLMSEAKPKRTRRRGVWVTLAATGSKAFLPTDLVEQALKENDERW